MKRLIADAGTSMRIPNALEIQLRRRIALS
jgi:hypothetical protein